VAAVDSITLTGNGVPLPRPTAELSATTVSFGNTIFGGAAPVQTLVLRNGGTVPLAIQSLVASEEYVQSNNCPATLAPNANGPVQLQFTPLSLGPRAGDFVVNSNAATSPKRVRDLAAAGSCLPIRACLRHSAGAESRLSTATSRHYGLKVAAYIGV
jgi:hypothetical protein